MRRSMATKTSVHVRTRSLCPGSGASVSTGRPGERGAALVIAILVLAILTVVGIALMLVTSTESRIAANEWSVNRAFYASDAGIRWASAEMTNPRLFLVRPEFTASAFGSVLFQMPSHRNGGIGSAFFSGDPTESDIQVRVQTPSLVGRRPYRGGKLNEGAEKAQFMWAYEVRTTGGENDAFLQYSKALVADIEVGPRPARAQ
ncbi:MAG: pilus assembly PilX N-terminal domain-containing protein [Acidobacteriota bacterium]